MARGAGQISRLRWPGTVAAALVLGVLGLALGAVAHRGGGVGALGPTDWGALRFTVLQAGLSAVISVAVAIPVARALARRNFRGRAILITLLGAPFILPVIVAVLGLLAIFGRNGMLNDLLALTGAPRLSIYGLGGVVLAHVFFNLPLAVRMLLQGWQAIPAERFRLAASLGAPIGRLLERPMLRAVVPGALSAIFLICLGSFAVALILGGGPKATTLELAIYQAVRFDFALDHAAALALVQAGVSAAAAVFAAFFTTPDSFGVGRGRVVARFDKATVIDLPLILFAALFLLTPLALVVVQGAAGVADVPASVFPAIGRSLAVAAAATVLTMTFALALALRGGWVVQATSALPLALSPLVIGTGVFLLAQPFGNPTRFALPVTAAMNALMALPFALRIIAPAVARVQRDYGPLSAALGLGQWTMLHLVILPRLRPSLGFSAGLTAALSLGDLGVIALFATGDQQTLPMLMVQLMGSYRTDAAQGAALILLGLAFGAFALLDYWGRRGADT